MCKAPQSDAHFRATDFGSRAPLTCFWGASVRGSILKNTQTDAERRQVLFCALAWENTVIWALNVQSAAERRTFQEFDVPHYRFWIARHSLGGNSWKHVTGHRVTSSHVVRTGMRDYDDLGAKCAKRHRITHVSGIPCPILPFFIPAIHVLVLSKQYRGPFNVIFVSGNMRKQHGKSYNPMVCFWSIF